MKGNFQMYFGNTIATMTVLNEQDTVKGKFYFCDCAENPAYRGFYSQTYIDRYKKV